MLQYDKRLSFKHIVRLPQYAYRSENMHSPSRFRRITETVLPHLMTVLLAACGGGDSANVPVTSVASADVSGSASASGSGSTETPSQPPVAQTFAAVRPAHDDWLMYSYSLTSYDTGTAVTTRTYFTRYFAPKVMEGLTIYTESTSQRDNALRFAATNLDDVSSAMVNRSGDGSPCHFEPPFLGLTTLSPGLERISGTYAIGDTWDQTSGVCTWEGGIRAPGRYSSRGSIAATERINVDGTTYSTVKEIFSVHILPEQGSPLVNRKRDYICWRDTTLGRNVKCDITSSRMTDSAATYELESIARFELVGYSLHDVPAKEAPLLPYVGNWRIDLNGSVSATCLGVYVAESGEMSGSCPHLGGDISRGTVGRDGRFSLSTVGGGTATGGLDSPINGSGSWSSSAGRGSFSISHL